MPAWVVDWAVQLKAHLVVPTLGAAARRPLASAGSDRFYSAVALAYAIPSFSSLSIRSTHTHGVAARHHSGFETGGLWAGRIGDDPEVYGEIERRLAELGKGARAPARRRGALGHGFPGAAAPHGFFQLPYVVLVVVGLVVGYGSVWLGLRAYTPSPDDCLGDTTGKRHRSPIRACHPASHPCL